MKKKYFFRQKVFLISILFAISFSCAAPLAMPDKETFRKDFFKIFRKESPPGLSCRILNISDPKPGESKKENLFVIIDFNIYTDTDITSARAKQYAGLKYPLKAFSHLETKLFLTYSLKESKSYELSDWQQESIENTNP